MPGLSACRWLGRARWAAVGSAPHARTMSTSRMNLPARHVSWDGGLMMTWKVGETKPVWAGLLLFLWTMLIHTPYSLPYSLFHTFHIFAPSCLPFACSLVRTFLSSNTNLTETAQTLSLRLFYALKNRPPSHKPVHTSHPDTSFHWCFSSSRSSDPALFALNLHTTPLKSDTDHFPPPSSLPCCDPVVVLTAIYRVERSSLFPGVKSYYSHERLGDTFQ